MAATVVATIALAEAGVLPGGYTLADFTVRVQTIAGSVVAGPVNFTDANDDGIYEATFTGLAIGSRVLRVIPPSTDITWLGSVSSLPGTVLTYPPTSPGWNIVVSLIDGTITRDYLLTSPIEPLPEEPEELCRPDTRPVTTWQYPDTRPVTTWQSATRPATTWQSAVAPPATTWLEPLDLAWHNSLGGYYLRNLDGAAAAYIAQSGDGFAVWTGEPQPRAWPQLLGDTASLFTEA